jgi:hypothetical protein
MVTTNQRVVAGKFRFTAISDSYSISELKFIIPNTRAVLAISDAVLLDTVSQVAVSQKLTPFFNGTNYVVDFTTNIPVNLNSSESLTIVYDTNTTLDSLGANINVAPVLVYAKAAHSAGAVIDGAATSYASPFGGISFPTGGITFGPLYLFKTLPTFAAVSSPAVAINDSQTNLYSFSITADPHGDLSIKQLTFTVTINDSGTFLPRLNSFTFFRSSTDITGAVNIRTIVNADYTGLTSTGTIGLGANTVVVLFEQQEVIPAGKTQTYSLKAFATGFAASSSVSTTLLGDTIKLTGGNRIVPIFTNLQYGFLQNPTDVTPVNYNVLWSDWSSTSPNPHNNFNDSYTDDWYNGYGVVGLPLGSQSVTGK